MINIQKITDLHSLPDNKSIIKWAKIALDNKNKEAEIVIRIVEEDEGLELNKKWCKKNYPTNVLSFPISDPMNNMSNFLGDIVICANVVFAEAQEQKKNINEHFAHMVIHGILHLQGYSHASDDEAEAMEKKEISMLESLGYGNPYEI
ncbi:MAG: rRNA maturation RNase YbeY [Gammaproteobacteria bacterium]|tara:strand:+ start:140 stop:583 length:444 start_codon:yes stop_codon:yes gene_type:complete